MTEVALPAAAEPLPAPSLGRALALLGVSVVLMLLIFGAFYIYQTRARDLNAPLFSAAISLGAVMLPTVVACFWPRGGAPGRLPSYGPPARAVAASAFRPYPRSLSAASPDEIPSEVERSRFRRSSGDCAQ